MPEPAKFSTKQHLSKKHSYWACKILKYMQTDTFVLTFTPVLTIWYINSNPHSHFSSFQLYLLSISTMLASSFAPYLFYPPRCLQGLHHNCFIYLGVYKFRIIIASSSAVFQHFALQLDHPPWWFKTSHLICIIYFSVYNFRSSIESSTAVSSNFAL